MKIGCISSSVFKLPISNYGGLEALVWQRAKGLAELGHQVTLFAPDGSTCPGCDVIPIGPAGQWNERDCYGRYWQYLPNFDVIIDDSWNKHSVMLKMEGRLKAPILQVMHAPINTMMQELPPVEKPCFVCISQDQADHFEALFSPDKHQKNRVLAKVAYNGCDVRNFYKRMDVPRTNRYLFVARFSYIKGGHIALDACQKTDSEIDLVGDTTITGEPEYLIQCQRMADGLKRKIIGGVSRGETVYWYSQARAFLHPNKHFREPFGLAPVEAMACGLAVAAFDYGAMRETIKHGETGFLVDTEEEFVDLLKSGQLDGIKRENCVEWAQRFSIENFVKRYDELVHEAVDGGGW